MQSEYPGDKEQEHRNHNMVYRSLAIYQISVRAALHDTDSYPVTYSCDSGTLVGV